ncbi:choice-of-anchor U domain-containing protein [Parahaliea aestuarii]|uniref:DUF5011 domain-containing protein n=1 Tax=Parahaliea aestuarii TaxID=1852021 RepID=A0A5C9A109_9GAMM|nr:choice-of-anchor U domain-containing protein [Parahaliea aestuarii]TXS94446.1 DUF5011 domain-containing protein [Parahaliea aestuarii]
MAPRFARFLLGYLLSSLISVAAIADGDPVIYAPQEMVPSGLNSGDTFYVIFNTEDIIDGTSANRSTYDDFVNAEADIASTYGTDDPSITWRALVGTQNDGPQSTGLFNSDIPIYNILGQRIAANEAALFNSINIPIEAGIFDQYGMSSCSGAFWTGLTNTGDLGSPLGSPNPAAAACNQAFGILYISDAPNDSQFPVLAVSPLLTVPNPAPTFTASFSPSTVIVGGITTLTYTIDNSAKISAATGLDFTHHLPASLKVALPSNLSTTCTGGILSGSTGATSVYYTGGTVSAGGICTISVDIQSSTAGNLSNSTGDLNSISGNSGTATATLTVNPIPTPSAPDITGITVGVTSVTLTFDPAGDNGYAITNYEYRLNDCTNYQPFSPAITGGPVVIDGLTPDTNYEISIRAINAGGAGDASAATPIRTLAPDNTPPVITLRGNAVMTLTKGGVFTDPGVDVTDDRDSAVTVQKSGSVNTNQIGTYTLFYNARDNAGNHAVQVTRTVTVEESDVEPVTTHTDNLPGGGTGSLQITGEDEACTITNASFTPAAGLPDGYQDFRGAVSFIANSCGGYVDVVMDFGTAIPAGAETWKSNGSWRQLVSATISGSTVSFRVIDGGPLDADGTVNGQINDPFAIFIPASTPGATRPTAVPAVPLWGLVLGALALFGIGRKRLKALN